MNGKTKKILIVSAIILVVLGISGVAAVLFLDRSPSDETQSSSEPEVTTHAPEEYSYNDDGSISSIIYYKDNVYNGRTDFFNDTANNTDYVLSYDADDNETESEKTKYNDDGTVSYYEKKENGTTVLSVDYNYYSETSKMKRMTTKKYDENGTENAEKLYFYENGKVSQRCSFVNGELTSQTFYDEEGNETK